MDDVELEVVDGAALACRHLERQRLAGQLAAVHVEDPEGGRALAVGRGHRRVLAGGEAQRRGESRVHLDGAALGIERDADADRDDGEQRLELGDAIAQVAVGPGQALLAGPPDTGQLQRGADAGQQLARAERLHQVVVGAGLEAVDARLLAGPRRERRSPGMRRSAASARIVRSSSRPSRRGIITSASSRSGGCAARPRRARPCPSATASTRLGRRQQAGDVVAHVGVVVGHDDTRRVPRPLRRRARPRAAPARQPVATPRRPAQRCLTNARVPTRAPAGPRARRSRAATMRRSEPES